MESSPALHQTLNFEHIFLASPGLLTVLSPDLYIVAATNSYLKAVNRTREEVIGKYFFDAFPDNPDTPDVKTSQRAKSSFEKVIKSKEKISSPIVRYDIKQSGALNGGFEERYWESTYIPILDNTGDLINILIELRDCTAHIVADREVKKSFDHIREITEVVGGVAWECNVAENKLTWSAAYKDTFGYTDQDLKTTPDAWDERVHPEDYKRIRASLDLIKATRSKTWTGEYRYLKADGSYTEVLDHGYIFYDEEGNLTRMLGSMVDLRQQKQREQELKESNERFERIAMVTNDVIWDWNLRNDSLWWNEGLFTLFGYKVNSRTNINFWKENIHPEDLPRVQAGIYQAIASGEVNWEDEYRFRSADGSYVLVNDKGYVIYSESGAPVRMLGAMLNITEKRRVEQERESQLSWMQKLLDSLPHMTWTATPEGVTEYFNERWQIYTGLSQEESCKMEAWLSAIHPKDQKHTIERWQHAVQTGGYYEIEYRIRNGREGSYRWFRGQGIPLRDEEGRVVQWIGTCTDIEDHKRAEEGLVEKNLELELINQDLDSFVYTASHDLKLPIINMASIFEELVCMAEFKDPDAHTMIGMFNRSLQQIHNTIHDLSEVVKVQKTKKRDLEDLYFMEAVQDVTLSLQSMINDTNTQLITEFSEAPFVPFTKGSLKSILYNLISNSIKYRSHERSPVILISSRIKDNFVELTVKDNGLGLDMNKHQNKLFQMFKRFHNHVNGSGLGLYIVNRLLTNHGGYINIDSNLGEGTTFTLYFKYK
ncbi:PAS domain-containing protein [Pontibacter locisalis]|uniref:histidine kinase n=1 Tax=Pontibacter locisalis TaxID=1719035 RepID=A0ABW5IHB9_9BACT